MLEGCFPEKRRFPEEKPAAWTEPAPAPELISRRKKISILSNLGTASVIVNFPEQHSEEILMYLLKHQRIKKYTALHMYTVFIKLQNNDKSFTNISKISIT